MSAPRFIRGTHRYQFRSGEWAEILMTVPNPEGKDCYVVRFADGKTDWWLVHDAADPYEFSDDPAVMSDQPSSFTSQ